MKYDFEVKANGTISNHFLQNGISSFRQASVFVKQLAYRRNTNKNDDAIVLEEGFGTCSTKHAVLKRLAMENNKQEIQLMLGMFKMNGSDTPNIRNLLEKYELSCLPEAHNYLKVNTEIIDCTFPDSSGTCFTTEPEEEISLEPHQISDFKLQYHQNYIKNWLMFNPGIRYSFNEIWEIREQCIHQLSKEP